MKLTFKNIIPWLLLIAVVVMGVALFKKSPSVLSNGAADVLSAGTITGASIWVHVRDNGGNCWDESWEYNGATSSWELAAKTQSYPCAMANSGPTGVQAMYLLDAPTVSYMQTVFVKNNFLKIGSYVTGKMDGPTVAALKTFQQKNNLPVNGWVDYRTKQAIYLLK